LHIPILGIKMPKMGMKPKTPRKKLAVAAGDAGALGPVLPRTSLSDALFTKTQQRVLGLLFGQPDRSFFATEVIALTKSGSGAVQRELRRLSDSGLAVVTKVGNQTHFQANPAAPVFAELRGIVLKTVGVVEPLKAALAFLARDIELAIVYGSVAKRTDTAFSDVDLLIVSDTLTLEKAYSALAAAERRIARKINVTLYTSEEFRRRRKEGHAFLSRVLAEEWLLLMGDPDGPVSAR
jgi:predicted nucleotidyltransferase